MKLLIGTDEAGYGPNLGPLVVGLSAWRIPADCPVEYFAGRMEHCIADQRTVNDPCRIPMADSKKLYQPARGMSVLEQAVLAAWGVAGINPKCVSEVWPLFEVSAECPIWHTAWEQPLPLISAESNLRQSWQENLSAGLAKERASLKQVRARVVQPAEFNRVVAAHGSKGTLLSEATLQLVRQTLVTMPADALADGTLVICDKHGGRNRYAPVLQHVFPECRIEILREGRAESAYLLHNELDQKSEFRFRTQGEEFLPTALASMTAKYLRELSMNAFNTFWQQHVPGIKPTAGYPMDAVRFRKEIAELQKKLAIADEDLWRCR